MTAAAPSVSLADIEAAAGRIVGHAVRTPLLRLPLDGEVYVKPESLQRTGSFKFRGAYNALAATPRERIERGVVADSSGNHAQGVAAAAALLGVPATIVMPDNATQVKVERTAAWGAEIVRCGPSNDDRQRTAMGICAERGLEYIPPFDDPRIIAGQGTVGLELARDLPAVRTVVVCIGGGGLISGVATAVKALRPDARVIGVEPELAADARASLLAGRIVRWSAQDVGRTICDGVRTQALGALTFAAISALVDEIVTVTDDDVLAAMRYAMLEAKLLLEPTGALTLAALLTGAVRADGPTALVASGGNADPALLATVLGRPEDDRGPGLDRRRE
jgi:threo-3-hydroxy-L-aspartate ammonia-lyase